MPCDREVVVSNLTKCWYFSLLFLISCASLIRFLACRCNTADFIKRVIFRQGRSSSTGIPVSDLDEGCIPVYVGVQIIGENVQKREYHSIKEPRK